MACRIMVMMAMPTAEESPLDNLSAWWLNNLSKNDGVKVSWDDDIPN